MTWHYHVPGRVELVGKHTDYAGGRSLTCATPFQMHARAEPITEPALRVHDRGGQLSAEVALSPSSAPTRARWSVYQAAVARRVTRDFPAVRTGIDVRLGSSVPPSMGLSSSSALVVSLTMALFDANGLWETPAWQAVAADELAFAQYCAAVESGAAWGPFAGDSGVGTRGGAQDHIAICASRSGTVGEYSYLPGRVLRRVEWPADWRIVVVNSGVKATKTGNARLAYNRVADSVRALVAAWNVETGRTDQTLAAALASASDAFCQLTALAPRAASGSVSAWYLVNRLAQYAEETALIVPGMTDAIACGDADAAGALMARSQQMAEDALENQVPQTVWLAAQARALGAAGATAFGAGFGGAVWALVANGGAEEFAKAWVASYRAVYGVGTSRGQAARVMTPSAGVSRSTS
ncbi:MAG: galactokinase family protein [Gemmatimonadota bacterium]